VIRHPDSPHTFDTGTQTIRYANKEEQNMKKVIWSLLVFAALTFTQSAPASASVLTFLMDGTFDVASLTGTNVIGITPFHLEATFDPASPTNQDTNPFPTSIYSTTARFTIGGTTYSSIGAEVFFRGSGASYDTGIMVNRTTDFYSGDFFSVLFNATNPELNVLAPSDTTFSPYGGSSSISVSPLVIPLSGGVSLNIKGILDNNDGVADPTASLVPEPTTYTLLGLGLGCVAFARRKMNKINQAENA
jgi:hypothetical protein